MLDYLSAEALIIARLKTELPELNGNVFSAADLDAAQAMGQVVPAAHVLYSGDEVVGTPAGSRSIETVDQEWYIVLVFRNARSQITGQDVRADAGPVILKTLKALQGWQPSVEHGTLKRISGVRPGFAAGFAYFPLAFTTRIFV